MITLYKYIFYKAYFFCIKVFKEKDFPWFFASFVVTMTAVTTLVVLLELLEYILLPTEINIYGQYQGYFALAVLGCVALYVKRNDKYVEILKSCEDVPLNKQKLLLYVTICYAIILFVSFFLLGHLFREYNRSH